MASRALSLVGGRRQPPASPSRYRLSPISASIASATADGLALAFLGRQQADAWWPGHAETTMFLSTTPPQMTIKLARRLSEGLREPGKYDDC